MRGDLNRDRNRIIHSLKEEEPDRRVSYTIRTIRDSIAGAVVIRYQVCMRIKFFLAVVSSLRIVYVMQRTKEIVAKSHSPEIV